MPTANAAIEIRPPSRISIEFTKPCPSSPSRFPSGTKQSSKTTLAVSEARKPSLFSFFDGEKPFMPFSKMNAEIPLLRCARSVTAIATQVSACIACVMKFFEPLTVQPPSVRTAVDFVPDASEPALGSVNPQAPSRSPEARGTRNFCFCSSDPYLYIWLEQSEL